jgi:hypothetical protein
MEKTELPVSNITVRVCMVHVALFGVGERRGEERVVVEKRMRERERERERDVASFGEGCEGWGAREHFSFHRQGSN